MRRRCLEIVDRSNMGFEFWSLNSCLYQRFGMKELYLIITQPVYEIKMKCLKEMMIVRSFGSESHPQNALNDMEASRTAVESVIQKQDYDRFVQKQLEKREARQADTAPHARNFVTLHGYYLHDHTLNQYSIIHPSTSDKSYATISAARTADRRSLESGSDCDVVERGDGDDVGRVPEGRAHDAATRRQDRSQTPDGEFGGLLRGHCRWWEWTAALTSRRRRGRPSVEDSGLHSDYNGSFEGGRDGGEEGLEV